MTPEREKYIAKCGVKELTIRKEIKWCKQHLAMVKEVLNTTNPIKADVGNVACMNAIRSFKSKLAVYRLELARLKGMDRVVVPYEVMRFGFEANIPRVSYNCECFEPIDRKFKYCPQCGKRILWEKVSK